MAQQVSALRAKGDKMSTPDIQALLSSYYKPYETHNGASSGPRGGYYPTCSCGWRGASTIDADAAEAQFLAHVDYEALQQQRIIRALEAIENEASA